MKLERLIGKPLRSYQQAQTHPSWLNIWDGSVSSSKTITTLFCWLDFVLQGPPGELVIIGKTERTVRHNILAPLIWMVGSELDLRGLGRGEIHLSGRLINIVSANDERAEHKIRGWSLVGAYVDEITILPESFFRMLLSRLRQPGARLYGTTNPDSPYHWLKRDYLDKAKKSDDDPDGINLTSHHFVLDDNPYLDRPYIENIKRTYSGLFYRRFILGEWCLAEGVIYDMWDESRHVRNTIPVPDTTIEPKVEWYVGVDYGTINPTAFLMIGIYPMSWVPVRKGEHYKKAAFVRKEYYYDSQRLNRVKTDEEYATDLQKFIAGTRIRNVILDPSAASFKVTLRNRGIPAIDGDNSVIDGIRTLAGMLGDGRYHVHPSCQNHRMEFTAYVWDEKSQKTGEDRPMKQNDHSMDAARYVVYTVLGKGEGRVIRI